MLFKSTVVMLYFAYIILAGNLSMFGSVHSLPVVCLLVNSQEDLTVPYWTSQVVESTPLKERSIKPYLPLNSPPSHCPHTSLPRFYAVVFIFGTLSPSSVVCWEGGSSCCLVCGCSYMGNHSCNGSLWPSHASLPSKENTQWRPPYTDVRIMSYTLLK